MATGVLDGCGADDACGLHADLQEGGADRGLLGRLVLAIARSAVVGRP